MTGARTVTAIFTPPPKFWSLSVQGGANGSGTVTSSPSGISCTISQRRGGRRLQRLLPVGLDVTLTAASAAGSYLKAWSGAGCDATGTGMRHGDRHAAR